ncbi:MAG: antitoxin [Deltaproteobacteria bacterium CG_4_8_14_3_um_filter_51_11]|nr:DUF86 domain-containing protein [bacterium]OIP42033.1 MAG: hypothetical protein AUK25_04565 [Desulfobacteraceae bacterium CG2_30_51_40]PIP46805.1 MAG: antitoxin [Deltaproteobacteria bacterium CG23_combo_of_CG06-09_8_20_14_all_51_20]PIX20848.1 MAG: antitoxin [Deltaproteobacteria bacterium CG_4_8_14_3_um_filter_51_11]PJB37164.1 MAG: antitoxin [Deltaproteobacteria bacterium CG_4_9_14_3_um_filter_51_14]
MVDKALILRKLSDLSDLYAQLEEYRDIPARRYASDWKTQRIVERTLQMMIEICLDVANHIISDKGCRRPVGYSDHFEVLRENAILDAGLASRMMKMAKFRNLIVHNYDKIDADIIVGILKKNLPDFDSFKTAVAAAIIKNLQK